MGEQKLDEQEKLRLARAFTDRLPAPEEIRDDWGLFLVETVLPEGVWSRPGLNQRDRSLATIAALTALNMPHELKLHIERGLENGLSRVEISELIMHMAIYAGFPRAVEGMRLAREVFEAEET